MIACKNYLRFLQGRELLRKGCSNFLARFSQKTLQQMRKKRIMAAWVIIVDH